MIKSSLQEMIIDQHLFYFMQPDLKKTNIGESTFLLPAFDEFLVGYADRSASIDKSFLKQTVTVNGIFKPIIVIDGKVEGLWKRTIKPNHILIEISLFRKLAKGKKELVQKKFDSYGSYLNKIEIRFM